MNTIDILWVLVCSFLVFSMQAGFTCLEAGLTRSKNNMNVAIKNLSIFLLSFFSYIFWGKYVVFGQSVNGLFGGFYLENFNTNEFIVLLIFGGMFCSSAMTILSGAVAERFRFRPFLYSIPFLTVFIYSVVSHWVWQKGILNSIGFVDFAGGTVVHAVGGWISLAGIIAVGPRIGRFVDNKVYKIQGSNLPLSVLGVLLLWFGWFGFNGGSTFKFSDDVPVVILNTLVGGICGGLTSIVFDIFWGHDKKIEIESVMNGTLAGLVGITGACLYITIEGAIVLGILGSLVCIGLDRLLLRLKIDDAISAVPVHLGASLIGTFLWPLFCRSDVYLVSGSISGQMSSQLKGIIIVGVYTFCIAFLIFRIINKFTHIRVSSKGEEDGLNIVEHGASTAEFDLLHVINRHKETGDLSFRAPIESFTDIGKIAAHYNQLLDRVENDHKSLQENSDKMTKIASLSAEIIHDIKTPLQTINGATFLLQRGQATLTQDTLLAKVNIISQSVNRIKDSLNFFLNTVKKSEVDGPQFVLIKNIADELNSIFMFQLKKIDAKLEFVFEKDGKIKVRPFQIIRVFQNLISNSLKALEGINQEKKITIIFDLESSSSEINITYSDSGPNAYEAINASLSRPIFSYQEKQTEDGMVNVGLGMRIVSKIIEQHHGTIEAKSNNPNTTIIINLPKA